MGVDGFGLGGVEDVEEILFEVLVGGVFDDGAWVVELEHSGVVADGGGVVLFFAADGHHFLVGEGGVGAGAGAACAIGAGDA